MKTKEVCLEDLGFLGEDTTKALWLPSKLCAVLLWWVTITQPTKSKSSLKGATTRHLEEMVFTCNWIILAWIIDCHCLTNPERGRWKQGSTERLEVSICDRHLFYTVQQVGFPSSPASSMEKESAYKTPTFPWQKVPTRQMYEQNTTGLKDKSSGAGEPGS